MLAGNLDRRITIERYTTVQNAFGEEVQTWATFITVWASKTDVKDGERMAAEEVSAEIGSRFVVRYSSQAKTINPKDRINYGGQIFDIVGVKEVGRRNRLEISANARADG